MRGAVQTISRCASGPYPFGIFLSGKRLRTGSWLDKPSASINRSAPSVWKVPEMMTRLFEPAGLAYGLRTAAGAIVALGLAWALGLEHPQWAGMTVWAASQPIRAHLVEKSLFRGAGTVTGAIFGVVLVSMAARAGSPALLVCGIALWLGLCAATGNLLRGFAGYGALLAGYTAVMVAVLDTGHAENVLALGLDRTATVLSGVLVALAIGLLLTPRGAETGIPGRLRSATAAILREVAATLRAPGHVDEAALTRMLAGLAALDDAVDGEGMGSLAARREAHDRRRTLLAQVGAILWLRSPTAAADPERADAVAAIADAFETNVPIPARRLALARAARGAEPGLRRILAELGDALPRGAAAPLSGGPVQPVALHRDWTAAREAGTRAAATMLAIGGLWLATGWPGAPMVMLGAAIMTSVFSLVDNPFPILPKVAAGQAMGVAAALACRWVIWPHLGSELALILAMIPFILLGAVLTGMPRLRVQSFDYNMVVLLLLQPALPLAGTFGHALVVGAAVAGAPLVGLAAFRLIHPPSAERRRVALAAAMVREVEAMAARPGATRRARVWRARLHHRLLHLLRRSPQEPEAAVAIGLAVLAAGRAVLEIEALLTDPGLSDSARRRLRLARARLVRLGQGPERAAAALDAAARSGGRGAVALAAAAAAVRANATSLALAGAAVAPLQTPAAHGARPSQP